MSNLAVVSYSSFVDKQKVLGPYRRSAVRLLGKSGAYTRQDIRRGQRYTKKKASKPGESPRYHTRGKNTFNIRNRIYFGVNKDRLYVIIGPDIKTIKIARAHEEGKAPPVYNKVFKPGEGAPIDIRNDEIRFIHIRTKKQARRANLINKRMKAALKKMRMPKRPFIAPQAGKAQDRFLKSLDGMLKG